MPNNAETTRDGMMVKPEWLEQRERDERLRKRIDDVGIAVQACFNQANALGFVTQMECQGATRSADKYQAKAEAQYRIFMDAMHRIADRLDTLLAHNDEGRDDGR